MTGLGGCHELQGDVRHDCTHDDRGIVQMETSLIQQCSGRLWCWWLHCIVGNIIDAAALGAALCKVWD